MRNHETTSSTTRKGLLTRIWKPGGGCVVATLVGFVMLAMSTSPTSVGTQVIFLFGAIAWFVTAAFLGVGTFLDELDLRAEAAESGVRLDGTRVLDDPKPYVRDETDQS